MIPTFVALLLCFLTLNLVAIIYLRGTQYHKPVFLVLHAIYLILLGGCLWTIKRDREGFATMLFGPALYFIALTWIIIGFIDMKTQGKGKKILNTNYIVIFLLSLVIMASILLGLFA